MTALHLIDQLLADFDADTVSQRGFDIGTVCEIFEHGHWRNGVICRIHTKTNTNLTYVKVSHYNEQRQANFIRDCFEWNRNIIIKYDSHHLQDTDIDYQDQINGCNGIVTQCIPTKRIIHALK